MRMWSRYSGPLRDRLPQAFRAVVLNPAIAVNSKFFTTMNMPLCRPPISLHLGERGGVTDTP